MAGFNPRWIVGKTVAKVEMNSFEAAPDVNRRLAHDPRVTFTDGSSIRFVTQETEVGEYGVEIVYRPARQQRTA